MRKADEWSGLAYILANMIEKYACEMNLEQLPDPDDYYKLKQVWDMYRRFMELRAQTGKGLCSEND